MFRKIIEFLKAKYNVNAINNIAVVFIIESADTEIACCKHIGLKQYVASNNFP